MTARQKILKAIYPLFALFSKLKNRKAKMLINENKAQPQKPFYDLTVMLNNGSSLPLTTLKGKKVLLVNTASDCGYTPQYHHLEILYKENKDKLMVIAFPSNDFGEQEKGSDEAIAAFCKVNFGVTFPLAKKCTVIKSAGQDIIFKWLTDKTMNGWNDQAPVWNFTKYLVDENGLLTHYFDPAVEPESGEIKKALERMANM
ncbi:MAG: glutathione peroxidase [Bacteroidetes bacterium]|nr:glutathione peroxidase [Bacteroidota bacterium]